ncbi:MAG: hypothetical protein U0792_00755 [Gemmataceae bacterium]
MTTSCTLARFEASVIFGGYTSMRTGVSAGAASVDARRSVQSIMEDDS